MPRRLGMGPGVTPVDIQAWEEKKSKFAGTGIDPRTGKRYGAVAPTMVMFPPEIYPSKEAQSFNITGTATIGPGPTALAALTAAFQLPVNMIAVVREITLNVNALLVTSLITFSLRFNQGPVPGFDNLFVAPRAAASVSIAYSPESVLVRVPDGSTIDIAVVVADVGGTYQMTANFRGWWYPKDTLVGY